MATVKILAIDGGGIRGLLPALILAAFEAATAKPVKDQFDLIAGTSTGGILACGLAAGIAASGLATLYSEHGGAIFAPSLNSSLGGVTGPDYSAKPLEAILQAQLGSKMLSDIKTPHLLVPAYVLSPTAMEFFFKSWKANAIQPNMNDVAADLDFPLWQVARATSAAPTYFPPATVTSASGRAYIMVDGGVVANNPAAAAVASARMLYGDDAMFHVLSLGTGSQNVTVDGKAAVRWGAIQWIRPIIDIFMGAQAGLAQYEIDQDPNVLLERVDAMFPADDPSAPSSAMDDATPANLARLEATAKVLIQQYLGNILANFGPQPGIVT